MLERLAAVQKEQGQVTASVATLRMSHVSSYLDVKQARLYAEAIDERAWLQEEKATAAWTEVIDTAHRLGICHPVVAQAIARRHEMRPDTWDGLDEERPEPHFLARASAPVPFANTP